MKRFKPQFFANQIEPLIGLQFLCMNCLEPKQAVVLESIAEDLRDGDLYCYPCDPDSWDTMFVLLAKSDHKKLLRTWVKQK